MKPLLLILASGLLAGILPAAAAESQKPAVTLTVKKQLIDADHDLRGKRGSVSHRVLTLRVEIVNTTASTIEGSKLSGIALVMRSAALKKSLSKESLGPLPIPSLQPGGKTTIDLGKIRLGEIEQGNRKTEETLEEWQVTCMLAGTEIGKAVSSDHFDALATKLPKPAKKKKSAARK